MKDAQLMKGILEGCVLEIISHKETYGYELIETFKSYGFTELQEGTLYPILTRLDKNKYITSRRVKSELGPIRKYYSITPEGIQYLNSFKESYHNIINKANNILGGIL